MDSALLRLWEESHMADCIIWVGLGLGGTRLERVRVNSHVSGNRVALHACLISGGIDAGVDEADLDLENTGRGNAVLWCVGEEREEKIRGDRRAKIKREVIEMRRHCNLEVNDGFEALLCCIFLY